VSDAGNGSAGLYARQADVLRLEERIKVVDRETALLRDGEVKQSGRFSALHRELAAVQTSVTNLGLSFNLRFDEMREDQQKMERRILEALARVT
jgi:hypothetical protein